MTTSRESGSQTTQLEPQAPRIRSATAADQTEIILLIGRVFAEYGERITLDGADSDLVALDESYFDCGGQFWVLADPSHVFGTSAVTPDAERPNVAWLKRLYLDHDLRGTGWGQTLFDLAVDWARIRDFQSLEFWSDTRFERAHKFYLKQGCEQPGITRTMYDSFLPYQEHFFRLRLSRDVA